MQCYAKVSERKSRYDTKPFKCQGQLFKFSENKLWCMLVVSNRTHKSHTDDCIKGMGG